MANWLLAALLAVHAHFAVSYLVPLDSEAQRTFGGLLKWLWPWAIGDGGVLGRITVDGIPTTGFFLAVTTGGLFLLAALAVVGIWVPFHWWRVLAMAGAVLLILLMLSFFGPTKLLPMALAAFVLWAAWTNWLAISAR